MSAYGYLMPENPTPNRQEQRRAWDAQYREKNRDRRREYDRERMRRIRSTEATS